MQYKRGAIFALSLLLGVMNLNAHAFESNPLVLDPLTERAKLLGHSLVVEERAKTLPSNQGVTTETRSEFLGHSTSLMEASVEAIPYAAESNPPPAPTGIQLATTDLYVGGTRVWAGTLRVDKGGLVYSGGIAPTQIPFPLVVYPLGPLVLELDAGVEFEGALEASLLPGLSYPLTDSTLNASVEARLMASGYVEGYASIWLVRGGVGGRVNLIDGSTGIAAHLYMNGTKPTGNYLGKVVLLSGDVYGFVDTKLFFGRWNRILKKDFYQWSGRCYAFDQNTCALN